MQDIAIIKRNIQGDETFRYTGRVLRSGANGILVEAFFNRPDFLFNGMWLNEGDRFVELYFTDRWYNIFEIHERGDDTLKGWYCNVTRPAEIQNGSISYIDLALDLLVFPDGSQIVLDEDEFSELDLDASTSQMARNGLEGLKAIFKPPIEFRLETVDLLIMGDRR